MPPVPTAEPATADADPAARQVSPFARARRAWPWLAIGLAAYLVTLIVTLPARFVVSPGPRWAVAGTLWSGEAVVDGAYRVQWRWAPLRSLASLAFAADMRMSGSGTDLAGTATVSSGRILIEGLAGRGDGGLLASFGPTLPFACDMPLHIDLKRLLLAGPRSDAIGTVRADPGACTPLAGGEPNPVPALVARIAPRGDGTTAIDVTQGGTRVALFRGNIAIGRLTLAPTPAGIAALPFVRGLSIDEGL